MRAEACSNLLCSCAGSLRRVPSTARLTRCGTRPASHHQQRISHVGSAVTLNQAVNSLQTYSNISSRSAELPVPRMAATLRGHEMQTCQRNVNQQVPLSISQICPCPCLNPPAAVSSCSTSLNLCTGHPAIPNSTRSLAHGRRMGSQ